MQYLREGVSIGGFIGSNSGTVSSCFSNGEVIGNEYTGGFIGYNSGKISNCYSTGNVNGTRFIGGLTGYFIKTMNNSHYNIDKVLINGKKQVTRGGLYNDQYKDWMKNNFTLNISNYYTSLVPSDGYFNINDIQGMKHLIGFAEEEDLKFKLTKDIDLSISPGYCIPFFSGDEFEGNNNTISNFSITIQNEFIGLFGFNEFGIINNLTLANISVIGYDYIGGLLGQNNGNVFNSQIIGNVSGNDYVGGLIGENNGNVYNSHVIGNVSGNEYSGGLIGRNEYGNASSSYNIGYVSGNEYSGGFIGGIITEPLPTVIHTVT